MTVLTVRLFGDPVLRTVADAIPEDALGDGAGRGPDPTLEKLVADMLETMYAHEGVGLAANQVGVTRRVFVYDCEGDCGHVINPVWEAIGEETEESTEGCLSIPGVGGTVERAARVRLTGTTLYGHPVEREVSGLLARCVQHETDHLDGTLFLSHLSADERREAMATIRRSEWFAQ